MNDNQLAELLPQILYFPVVPEWKRAKFPKIWHGHLRCVSLTSDVIDRQFPFANRFARLILKWAPRKREHRE